MSILNTPAARLGLMMGALLVAACAGTHKPMEASSDADAEFSRTRDALYWAHLEARPTLAVYLGHHQFDGKLPDVSEAALKTEIDRLNKAQQTLGSFDETRLSPLHRVERDALLFEIRQNLFELEVMREPWRNPTWYGWGLSVSNYVARDYAPREQRAQAIIEVAGGFEAFVSNIQKNLDENIPITWIETGLLQVTGNIEFIQTDVKREMRGLDDPRLEQRLETALDQMVSVLEKHRDFLEARKKGATADYALGEEMFLRMLKDTQGLEISLSELEAIANETLQRDLDAIAAAAREIDPEKETRVVVDQVLADTPPVDGVIAEAGKQAAQMRQFLIDHDIVSIPSNDVAEVRPSPPFMRWNYAFLSGAGPFEKKALPSFYYITPPDPSWSEEDQLAYLPGKSELLATTIHELWPGHFLHGLHSKQVDSDVLKSFWNYSMGEGWAHYAEEMMVEQGAGGTDPRIVIGQLTAALVRDVRFVSAIGLHAQGMTVEESEALFADKGFLDPASAKQQAVRGTNDPMYLSYTLGKLMILKLRDDWKAQEGDDYSLKRFHNEFLSYGGAPIPVIRKAMLENDSGELL